MIEELLKLYPPPTHLRMDNGPEFIANALQEWCMESGCSTAYIPPGSPWENKTHSWSHSTAGPEMNF